MKKDIFIVGLAILSIILLSLDSIFDLGSKKEIISYIDLSIVCIFWIEFIFNFLKAERKIVFIKKSWADIIGMIPLTELSLRIFRLFRVFRILRVSKVSKLTRVAKLSKKAEKASKIGKRIYKKLK